jgi:hypothetical protein
MAETEASVSSGKKKKVGVGHPSGLAVAVRAQICMSVLVALGQVGRAGDRGEPEPGNENCKLSNLMASSDNLLQMANFNNHLKGARAYFGGFVSDLQVGRHSTTQSWLGSTK